MVVECNLDDISPQIIPYVIERLLAIGANDAWAVPIIMKKGRPAFTLKALCAKDLKAKVLDVIFAETTTLGVRFYEVERAALERRWETVATKWGEVRVKIGSKDGKILSVMPEFEDLRALAQKHGVPIKAIAQSAMAQVKL